MNTHCNSEYEAELHMLAATPDDCISINPRKVMRNHILKQLKSVLVVSLEVEKIYYRDFGEYSVIAEQGRKGYSCTIFRGGNRCASITYLTCLGSLDQNTIHQILSTIEFDQ